MERFDWLTSYASIKGIHRALSGLSYRAKYESRMHEAAEHLEKDYDLYREEFDEFFPQLEEHVVPYKELEL